MVATYNFGSDTCMFAILTKVKNKVSCGDYGLCFHKAVVDKSMQIGCSN